MKTKILVLLIAILPILSGCNNTENVKGMITGKTWRLSCFMYNDDLITRYPNVDDIFKNNPNGFYLKFNENNTFYGQAINCSFNGTWSGDGKTNDFSMNITSIAGDDSQQVIATDFVKAVKAAYSYKGDDNILSIYYKYNGSNEHMVFKVK